MGLAATAMSDYFSWGIYIINFVFFIGISHAGTLVSAILRVTGAEWRRPITRMAEGITVFALMIGGADDRDRHGAAGPDPQRRPARPAPVARSSGTCCSVTTYLTGSLIYLYLPMIPDLAMLRDLPGTVRCPFGPVPALGLPQAGYRLEGTPEQWRRLERAISAMAVVIIPVAMSVHTVVSWIFGMTLRPGWHSTIFGPYFVVGAIFSGIAALHHRDGAVRLVLPAHHLDRYITPDHFKKLASLLLAVNLIYIYFTISEYLTMGYPSEAPDRRLLDALFGGQYACSSGRWRSSGCSSRRCCCRCPGRGTSRGS